MKFSFLLVCVACCTCGLKAQTIDVIHYQSQQPNFSFDYPSEWDSSYLPKLKARIGNDRMNVVFGALIKPDYKSNGKGASFMITTTIFPHMLDSAELVMMKANAEDYYKLSADGKLEYFAFTKTKKTGLPCIVSIVKSDYDGLKIYVYTYEVYKGNMKYMVGLNSHELAYPKLKEPFEEVMETFE